MSKPGSGVAVAGIVAFPLVLILGLVLAVTSASGAGNACTPSTAGVVNATAIPTDATVAGFGREQLVNAAAIISAASAQNLPAAAQTLGVQTAIGESSLKNINYGDLAGPDSRGLFQQRDSWGTLAQRMDPATSASLFFQRLTRVPGWETLDPSVAINAVQVNADPYYYTKFRAKAVAVTSFLATLGGAAAGGSAGGACSVPGDVKALAVGLQTAMDNGTLHVLEPRYAAQITNLANGTAQPGCLIDVRILQFITLAVQKFTTVGVSDLNRHCTGSLEGAGAESAHYMKGGGLAVDFYALNGHPLNGANTDDLALLDLLSSVAPDGSRAGQSNCRSPHPLPHVVQFPDTCDHQHIDFGFTDGPLNVTS